MPIAVTKIPCTFELFLFVPFNKDSAYIFCSLIKREKREKEKDRDGKK